MPQMLGRLYRRLGTRYFSIYVVFEVVSAFVVCLATVGIFSLYTETSPGEFWRVVAVAEGAVAVAVGWVMARAWQLTRPVIRWVADGGPEEGALEAWRDAVSLPRAMAVSNGWQPFVIVGLPVAIYSTIEFDLPAYSAAIIFAGTVIAIAYAAILHFFASEIFMRPVLEDIALRLPDDFGGARLGVPLRWKLLGALPLINVITGVVASGLSSDGDASLNDLAPRRRPARGHRGSQARRPRRARAGGVGRRAGRAGRLVQRDDGGPRRAGAPADGLRRLRGVGGGGTGAGGGRAAR